MRWFILINFYSITLCAKEIPIIVISAGKSTQSYSTVGSDIEVIDSVALEKSEHNFLGDILDNAIPGANYFQNGGKGTTAGIQLNPSLELTEKAQIIYLEGLNSDEEAVIGLHNFYVITTYNRNVMYALAVLELGESIEGLVTIDAFLFN